MCSSRAAGDVQILWQMWHLVCHTQFVPTDSPGGDTMAGAGDGVLDGVLDCGDLRMLRSSSPALPLDGGLLLLFSSFSFSLLGLALRGDSLDGDGTAIFDGLLRWFMTAALAAGRWFMVPFRLWITEISFIFPGSPGAKPFGKPGNGGKGNISLGGLGNPPKNSESFGAGKVGGRVSIDMRRPLRDGELFHIWVPMCTLRLPLVVNALWQMVHLNGFSPV